MIFVTNKRNCYSTEIRNLFGTKQGPRGKQALPWLPYQADETEATIAVVGRGSLLLLTCKHTLMDGCTCTLLIDSRENCSRSVISCEGFSADGVRFHDPGM